MTSQVTRQRRGGHRSSRKERLTQIEALDRIERILPSQDSPYTLAKMMIAPRGASRQPVFSEGLEETLPASDPALRSLSIVGLS
jgi:hypothetical protein